MAVSLRCPVTLLLRTHFISFFPFLSHESYSTTGAPWGSLPDKLFALTSLPQPMGPEEAVMT